MPVAEAHCGAKTPSAVQSVDLVTLHRQRSTSTAAHIQLWDVDAAPKEGVRPRPSTESTASMAVGGQQQVTEMFPDAWRLGDSDVDGSKAWARQGDRKGSPVSKVASRCDHARTAPCSREAASEQRRSPERRSPDLASVTSAQAEQAHCGMRAILGQPALLGSPLAAAALAVHRAEWLDQLDRIVGEVARHYSVLVCMLAVEIGSELHSAAQYGPTINPQEHSADAASRRRCAKQFMSEPPLPLSDAERPRIDTRTSASRITCSSSDRPTCASTLPLHFAVGRGTASLLGPAP